MRRRARRRGLLPLFACAALAALAAFAGAARAWDPSEPVLHERIAPNAAEDLALRVNLEGDFPAAIPTPHANADAVSAPDPTRPPGPSDAEYGPASTHDEFTPDTDTRSPTVSDYDDPFTPSTAPFKRLEAFDAVRSDYRLEVRDSRLVALPAIQAGAPLRPDEDGFFADIVVDVPPEGSVRLPSVGPGARVVRSRLGAGDREIPFRILRDGADNWFLQAGGSASGGLRRPGASTTRARLVMELAIARAAFGGAPADASWSELPYVAPLPDNVARDAAVVRAAIGVNRSMRPREAIAKLVEYFRGFSESADPPAPRGSIYLDLALSKKGVCRHRAFAFLVTAQSLGIPTRLVENEAHAWVEIEDGTLWRRIDLGGAGRLPEATAQKLGQRDRYQAPADGFSWPKTASRGDAMITPSGGPAGNGPGGSGGGGTGGGATSPGAAASASTGGKGAPATPPPPPASTGDKNDPRPRSTVSLAVVDALAHRGMPLHVRGEVRADDEPCPHVAVDLFLRDPASGRRTPLGTLATDDSGAFDGSVVPPELPLGDYDVGAATRGDARCGASAR
ncbi:MAG TPA: transglutaminase-like domain-containing protein [Polyangiaceae bacterium]|nr:transglutaminase-like domain-containing protein [Polyangiaceae bacterium]